MENVVLIIHLLLALALIGVVLLQRSEGGGLGMGGGGGGGGATAGRSAATAMGKLTWLLAIAFIATSMTLTIIAAQKSSGSSVLDRITDAPAPASEEAPALPDAGDSLLPPSSDDTAPLTPTAD
jgi:preprotein translocase subunit SecG